MLSKSPTKLSEAALLADEFTATRRANEGNFKQSTYAPQMRVNQSNQSQSKEIQKESQTPVMQNSYDKPDRFKTNVFKASSVAKPPPAASIKCAYCKKTGHNVSELCYASKQKK